MDNDDIKVIATPWCLTKAKLASRNSDGTVTIDFNGKLFKAEAIVVYRVLEETHDLQDNNHRQTTSSH